MREESLLPCPFCGGEPEEDAGCVSEYYGHEHQDYSISCTKCGAEVYCNVGTFDGADVPCSCHHDTRKVCVDKWNMRQTAAPAAQAEQLSGNTEQVEPVTTNYTLPEWLQQAHKLAELHGTSFVVFRHGEEAQCADPTKVIISFTDEGLGHHSAAPQQDAQEVKK
ncbi:Lar family restriction alleviation protein [Atlantibacter sp.]|uniref:Lar family restriction alleviation protein n=1 Tax=Atlantibacter sp. TaxID=1903473 RepID=UPI0028A9AAD0|nr:Lar family restriction alleviation protein [Atlantibacter sp.]